MVSNKIFDVLFISRPRRVSRQRTLRTPMHSRQSLNVSIAYKISPRTSPK